MTEINEKILIFTSLIEISKQADLIRKNEWSLKKQDYLLFRKSNQTTERLARTA